MGNQLYIINVKLIINASKEILPQFAPEFAIVVVKVNFKRKMITERLYSVHGRWQLLSKRCPFLATLRTRILAPKKFSFNFLQHLLIKFSLRCFSHVILGGEGCFCVVEGGEKGFKFFLTQYFFKPMCCA